MAAALPVMGLAKSQAEGTAVPATSADVVVTAAANVNLLDEKFTSKSGRHFGSQIIHFGEQGGYQVTPISQDKAQPAYQRPGNMTNPTVAALLSKIVEMEGTEAAAGAPCGMGIISQTMLAMLRPGDRLVTHHCNYDGVMSLFREYLRGWGVKVEFVNMTDPENLAKALKSGPVKMVHFEPYVNPSMEVLDAPALIRIAKDAGAVVSLDNTWLTPYLFQPFRVGADLVIHSVTKYIGGHGNAMGGVVSGKKDLVVKIDHSQTWMGGLLRPMDAFLITSGVKTLPLRMKQHCRSALMVAEFLESHPAVQQVRYGGLTSWNPAAKAGYLKAFGGMMGVVWKRDSVHKKLAKQLRLVINATSLGDPVSRVIMRTEENDRNIPANYTRISIGLEEPEDIVADLKQAIEKCG